MEHTTAESFLQSLATKGGVIVSSGDMSSMLVSTVQAHSDWFVLPNGLGFGRLDKWDCPKDQVPKVTGDIQVGTPVTCTHHPV
jgi:hypothetical protein